MKRLEHPNAWSWLCGLAAAEGIELEGMSLAQAADRVVSQLERRRDARLALRLEAVRLAALLVRLEGEMVAAGATSPGPFVERAYARARALKLGGQYEAGLRAQTNPGALPQDEPEPEPEWVSVYDSTARLSPSLVTSSGRGAAEQRLAIASLPSPVATILVQSRYLWCQSRQLREITLLDAVLGTTLWLATRNGSNALTPSWKSFASPASSTGLAAKR